MKRKSLTDKTIRTTVLSCIILGLLAMLIGLGLYGYTVSREYITRAFEIAQKGSDTVLDGADSLTLAVQVMERYKSLSEEQRQLDASDKTRAEYCALFSDLAKESGRGGNYSTLLHVLRSFAIDVDYVYLAMYDLDTEAMVYIADPDQSGYALHPGEWESVNRAGLVRFMNWDGEGMLYDIDNTETYGWMCTAGYPIRDASGEIREFLLVDVSINSVIENMIRYAVNMGIALVLATALITGLVSRRIRRAVVEPINAISGAAVQYVQDKLSGEGRQDHFASLGIQTGDELERLSQTMALMERDIAEHEEKLTAITAERQRIEAELTLATSIQAAMLPHIFPAFPERSEFDIYASMKPAKEVGGDFYDFFLVDEDHLCLVMADVSGKGVPAALFMMASKIILQNCAQLGHSPAAVLTRTNEMIFANNDAQMFVTVWLGILEISSGRLTCASAGHEYPMLRHAGQPFELFKDRHGLPVGARINSRYREYDLQLEPGSKIFVYTDGVPEATSSDLELFGVQRTVDALNTDADASPKEILEHVQKAVDAFVRDAEQFDDLTMLCMEYRGSAPKEGEAHEGTDAGSDA